MTMSRASIPKPGFTGGPGDDGGDGSSDQSETYGGGYRLPWRTGQILRGSFSAVWTATVARVGAFCNIFRDLQDLYAFAALRSKKFSKNRPNFCRNEEMKFNFIRVFR